MPDWDTEWITTKEAAELTGYAPIHLRQLAQRGKIIARKRGRDWFLSKADLLAYKEQMDALGTLKHSPWREDLTEQGQGRKSDDTQPTT